MAPLSYLPCVCVCSQIGVRTRQAEEMEYTVRLMVKRTKEVRENRFVRWSG